MALKALCLDGLQYLKEILDERLAEKVDKVNGKGLSTNDFTDAYREKLDELDPDVQGTVVKKITKREIDAVFGIGVYSLEDDE